MDVPPPLAHAPSSTAAAAPPRAGRLRRWARRVALVTAGTLVLVPTLMWLAVGHAGLDPAYAGPLPRPAELLARFDYPERGTACAPVHEVSREQGTLYERRWVQFPVTTPGDAAAHLVQVVHYRPARPGRLPAVVVSPILGGKNELEGLVCAALAARGLHAALVLRAESYLDPAFPEERIEQVLRTAVIDRRRAVDWLAGLPEVDPGRIGALGISLGAIATTILAAAEPRVRASVLVMAGGDLGDVLCRSEERRLRRYVEARAAAGVAPDALRQRIRDAVVSDPLRVAAFVDARAVLSFSTRFDGSIPPDTQDLLHEALGRPERYTLPTGHYSFGWYLPYVVAKAAGFFEARLQ